MICLLREFAISLGETLLSLSIHRARIVPSNQTTYTLAQLQGAIKSQTGAIPYFGCQKGGTVLAEVWYFSHVYGTVCFLLFFSALGDAYLL